MDELLLRQMPHSTEAEQAVLGSMLLGSVDELALLALTLHVLLQNDFHGVLSPFRQFSKYRSMAASSFSLASSTEMSFACPPAVVELKLGFEVSGTVYVLVIEEK